MKVKRFLSMILCILLTLTLLPMTTQAAGPADILHKLPESTPGGLTITWYSAKRFSNSTYTNTSGKYHILVNIVGYNTTFSDGIAIADGQIDEAKSKEAYNNLDRSVCLRSEILSGSSLDADKWISSDDSSSTSDVGDCYVWGEVNGYVKMPRTGHFMINPSKEYNVDYALDIFGMVLGKWGTNFSFEGIPAAKLGGIDGNLIHEKDKFIPFTFRIGKMHIDSGNKNEAFSLEFYTAEANDSMLGYGIGNFSNLDIRKIGTLIPAECIYAKLSLKDMQRFFMFNPSDYTLTLDPIHKTFPVENYEYGIVTGDVNDVSIDTATGFQPLKLGVNYITPDSGTIVIRNKTLKTFYISLGTAYLDKPRNMAITRRTPTASILSWDVPLLKVPDGFKIKYDIYRKETGQNPKFVFFPTVNENEPAKVGSTTDLTFTDQGLKYDAIYEYFVKASYPTGFSPPSDIVKTDSVTMEGLSFAPTDLKVDLVNQTTAKTDLKLNWSASKPRTVGAGRRGSYTVPIKEYIIYRKVTRFGISDLFPREIARTADTSYVDRGFGLSDKCEYYIQAVDIDGSPSYFSSPIEVSIQNLIAITPKIAPCTLMIGNGDTEGLVVQYDSSYTGERSGTWSVADSSVVSVEENNTAPITINPRHTIPGTIGAKVTGKKPGATIVTFTNTATGARRDCNVTVQPAYKIAPVPLTVYTDETGSLAVTFDAGYTGSRIGSWSVDDNTVASIDQNGVVTGKKTGTAIATYAIDPTPTASVVWNGIVVDMENTAAVVTSASPAYNIVKTVPVMVKQGTFTVTFDPVGGSPKPPSATIRHDTTVARPDDPSLKDMKFLGWYTALSGGSKWDFAKDKVTADMTLYARWIVIPKPSKTSSKPTPVYTAPTIAGPDTINLLKGYDSIDQTYTFDGHPAPTYGISPTEPNTAGAAFSGTTLTIPAELDTGSYEVTLFATNSVGTATKTVTVNVNPEETLPTITGPDTINLLTVYESVYQAYTFSGSPAPTYGISPTEPNTANATFSGNTLTIPEGLDAGSYAVTLTATNSAGTATKAVTVNVYPVITINFVTEIEFFLSREDNRIDAFGGAGGPYTFTLSPGSSMPVGLTLNPDGTITGTASTGVYDPVSVVISDRVGNSITTVMLAVRVSD